MALDVDMVVKCIWDFLSSASFKTLDVCLNATIVLNLLIDGVGRVGEMFPEARTPERFLSWDCVKFWLSLLK